MGQPVNWNYSGTGSQYDIQPLDGMQMLRDRQKQRFFNNPTTVDYYAKFRPEGMSDEQWNAALNAYLEDQIYPNMMSNAPRDAFWQWLPAWQAANSGESAGIQQMPKWGSPIVNQRY
jgi:hypothetical protein